MKNNWFIRFVFWMYGGRYKFLSKCFEDWEKQTILMALDSDEKFYYTKLDREPQPYMNFAAKRDMRTIFSKRDVWS